ncbi:hypothetical protein ACSBR1_038045 [Camellia fascicularis]
MAETAVFHLLANFAPFLQGEVNLLSGVQEAMEDIRDEFERMSAFLRVADTTEEREPELKVWVKQVRDATYDTEDVLDKFKLHLAQHHGDGFSGFLRSMSNVVNNSWNDYRGDALLLEEAKLVGIKKPKRQLIEWLVEGGSRLKAVSVVGMGDLGKTTLVKKVYDDATVKKHFNCHAWLTISEMLKDWEAIKHMLPDKNCGSRVILTTRFTDIVSTCCNEIDGNDYTLTPLSPEESWMLFCNKTFQGNLCPLNLKKISLRILKRCKGLLLAIVAISGVLATKDKSRIDKWEMLYRSLGAELEGNDKLGSMKKALSLSHNDLPYYLKICFLYLSIFPEDQQIWCGGIIQLWIVEGFVNVIEGKTIEEVAKGYLDELFNRSLIQVAERYPDERPSHFCIHDLMREIIVSKAREQNIVTTICKQGSRRPEKVRRLLIRSTSDNVEYSERFSQLRSLFVWGPMDLLPIASLHELFRRGSRLLNVFDLEGTPLENIPDEVFKLIHLRYLGLRNTKVKMVPKLIGKLEKLENIDLGGTYVTELPGEVLHPQRLHNLISYHFKSRTVYLKFGDFSGFKAPSQIGRLQYLQVLWKIKANQRSEGGISIVKELGRLTKLRELSIGNLRQEYGVTMCSSIEKLNNLRILTVISTEDDEILDLQSLSPVPQFLQQLYLTGHFEKDDPLQSLQELPNLPKLVLDHAYEGEGLCFKAGGFQRLKFLLLYRLKGLRCVRVEERAMPHLETLMIRKSELIEEVPSGIEHLTHL